MVRRVRAAGVLLYFIPVFYSCSPDDRIVLGGKNFNEGTLLAEIMAQVLEHAGFAVDRRFQLGGTMVCFSALLNGEIDAYPEYTGTLSQAVFKSPAPISLDSLRALLEHQGALILEPFGFNNTYALAMSRQKAARLGIRNISDLRRYPELRFGFSLEFLNRDDGWPGLQRAYELPQRPRGLEHGLAYIAITNGDIDLTDAYSTDGDIPRYDLILLQDDRRFFPTYLAVPLVRKSVPKAAREALVRLGGRIDAATMQQLNAQVVLERGSPAVVATGFLEKVGLIARDKKVASEGFWELLWRRTLVHIRLTAIALISAMLIAIPIGVAVYNIPPLARGVVYIAGLLQTIPSIALLAFMIPLFGIGTLPAIVALFLYSLLPILRNTTIALFSVDPVLKKVAIGMGMTRWQQLKYVELPLAAPTILAGIKTAAVINIGTATLAAFIGAGGLGEPIVTGLTLNDPGLILQGAVPAALLAVVVELLFEWLERGLIPAHLRNADRSR